jgi:hypothetical protein
LGKGKFIRRLIESTGGGSTGGWKSSAEREEEKKAFEKVRDVRNSTENISQLGVTVKLINNYIKRYGVKDTSPEYKYLKRMLDVKKLQLGLKRHHRERSDENEDPSVRLMIKKIIREETEDLDWIVKASKMRLKPYELMGEIKKVFPNIEMEMVGDQETTGGYTVENDLMITTHKEINPTNEEWFNRISGVMVKLSVNEEVDKKKLPYLIGDWYENYYEGLINDSDADWNIYGDLNDVIEYIKQYVGPNGEPHIYYGEEEEEW